MIQKIFLLCLIFLLNTQIAQANANIAKVTFIKGKATGLFPRHLKATKITKNLIIKEGTSLLTYDRSVLKIKFFDGAVTTLGPNSKFVVKRSDPKKGSILGLLKGTIRTQVKKNQNKRLFIKTRTAALGVRGTDFQTIYNPEIRITSVVTFSGKVAIAKSRIVKLRGKRRNRLKAGLDNFNQNDKLAYEYDTVSNTHSSTSLEDDFGEFDNMLESEEAVEVNPGRFSTTATNLKKPTIPVRISPAQFKVMKKNTALNENVAVKMQELEKETVSAQKSENIKIEANDPPPEGYSNITKNEFAPKSGGFIDVNTGIYIPPESGAKFNKEANVFIPSKKVGQISEKTGSYIAPKGLKLDARDGFVLKVAKVDNKTLKIQEELNKEIKKIGKTEEQEKAEESARKKELATPSFWLNGPIDENNKYKLGHHHIQFGIIPGGSFSKYQNPYTKADETHHTKGKGDMRLEYTWRINSLLALGLQVNEGSREFNLTKQECYDCNDNGDNSGHWARRFIFASLFANNKTYMRLGFGEAETPYAVANSYSLQYDFKDINNTMFLLTFNRVFYGTKKFKIMGELSTGILLKKEDNGQISRGHDFGSIMEFTYELNTWFGVYTDLEYFYRYLKVTQENKDPSTGTMYDNTTSSFYTHNYGIGFGVLFSI